MARLTRSPSTHEAKPLAARPKALRDCRSSGTLTFLGLRAAAASSRSGTRSATAASDDSPSDHGTGRRSAGRLESRSSLAPRAANGSQDRAGSRTQT